MKVLKYIGLISVIVSSLVPLSHGEILIWGKDATAPVTPRYYFMQLRVIQGEQYLVGFDTQNSNNGMTWRKSGGAWVDLGLPAGLWLDSITGTSASDLWVSGNGRIMHYDGLSWTQQLSFTGELAQIYAITATHVFAVGTSGLRYQTIDGGINWVKLPNGLNDGVQFGLSAYAEDDIWVGGGGGVDGYTPYADYYNGLTWTTYLMEYGSKVTGIGKFGSYVYACGYSGKVWKFDGSNFNSIGLPSGWSVVARGIAVDGDGNCWVVGDRGFVLSYDSNSGQWETQMYLNNSAKDFKSVCINGFDIYAVGEDGVWFAEGNWSVEPPCDSTFIADFNCDHVVNALDFAVLAQEWLMNDSRLYPLYPE